MYRSSADHFRLTPARQHCPVVNATAANSPHNSSYLIFIEDRALLSLPLKELLVDTTIEPYSSEIVIRTEGLINIRQVDSERHLKLPSVCLGLENYSAILRFESKSITVSAFLMKSAKIKPRPSFTSNNSRKVQIYKLNDLLSLFSPGRQLSS